jgi:hypothetical protein
MRHAEVYNCQAQGAVVFMIALGHVPRYGLGRGNTGVEIEINAGKACIVMAKSNCHAPFRSPTRRQVPLVAVVRFPMPSAEQ